MPELIELFRTGPNTVGGRYMRTLWHPILIAAELKPGWAKPVQILGEKFTLYRGESGTPHLTAFRCAHRGLQLSVGWIEGDCIRCRFHGWKYDGNGQCVEVPTEDESTAKTVRLRPYPVREYLGLIFTYIGAGRAPDFPRYPDFESGGELWVEAYTRACNFVINMENDPVHIPFAHRESELFANKPPEVPVKVDAEETDWGIDIRSTFANGWVHTNQRGWPNMTCFKSPRQQHRSHSPGACRSTTIITGVFKSISCTTPPDQKRCNSIVNATPPAAAKSAARTSSWAKRSCAANCAFKTSTATTKRT